MVQTVHHKMSHRIAVGSAVLCTLALATLVAVGYNSNRRSELEFANQHEYLDGFVWSAPYPGAGPETPTWSKTPGSVGQGATSVLDEAHREHNVLGNDYKYPDYARSSGRARQTKLWDNLQRLWVGSPGKFLPPDGDYPGGATGIPEDGYLAYETGWGNDGPFHGELAPMQEAGIAQKARYPQQLRTKRSPQLSIVDPDSLPQPFNDFELGNNQAKMGTSYNADMWENPHKQPLDDFNMGVFSCTMGSDCHDRTHQGGLHGSGDQMFDNYPMGSIDRNSPKSSHAEYKHKSHKMPKLAFPPRSYKH
jgi:hypothetical protein